MTAPDEEAEEDELLAIWRGLSAPSLASCVGAVLFALAEVAFACWYVQPARIAALPASVLKQSDTDEYLALSLRLLRYHAIQPRMLQVAYLGASTATQSLFTRDLALLSQVVTTGLERQVRFNMWSSNGQRYEDALVIAEQLPPGFTGVFVLVVNDYKDDDRVIDLPGGGTASPFFERILAEASPARDELWRSQGFAPRRTGIFFLDHLDFFAARRIAAIRPPREPDRDREVREPLKPPAPPSLAALRSLELRQRNANRRLYDPPILAANRPVIEKLLDVLAAREIPAIFVEAPLNPRRASHLDERIQRYYHDMAAFAASRGAAYWNWNDELDLMPDDFKDKIHLQNPEARLRFQKRLTDGVVEVLKSRYGQDPSADEVDMDEGKESDG